MADSSLRSVSRADALNADPPPSPNWNLLKTWHESSPSENQHQRQPTRVPLLGTSWSRRSRRSCGSGPDLEQTFACGQRGTGRSITFSTASTIAKTHRVRKIFIFALYSSSMAVRANTCHARFVFGLCPCLAASHLAIIVGIGVGREQVLRPTFVQPGCTGKFVHPECTGTANRIPSLTLIAGSSGSRFDSAHSRYWTNPSGSHHWSDRAGRGRVFAYCGPLDPTVTGSSHHLVRRAMKADSFAAVSLYGVRRLPRSPYSSKAPRCLLLPNRDRGGVTAVTAYICSRLVASQS